METKRHTNALSSQWVHMNHWHKPSAVIVTASAHEAFLKVSARPARLTWLGSLSRPDCFRTKKKEEKRPACFWIIGNYSWAKYAHSGDLKTTGILCQTTGSPPAWETCLWRLPDRAQHQCLQAGLNTMCMSCIARTCGSTIFFKHPQSN